MCALGVILATVTIIANVFRMTCNRQLRTRKNNTNPEENNATRKFSRRRRRRRRTETLVAKARISSGSHPPLHLPIVGAVYSISACCACWLHGDSDEQVLMQMIFSRQVWAKANKSSERTIARQNSFEENFPCTADKISKATII